MRKAYVVALPPGAGKTRTVLKHLKQKARGSFRTLCNNLLVIGPKPLVEHVWLRELAILTRNRNDPGVQVIKKQSTSTLRKHLHAKGLHIRFLTFTEINRAKSMPPSAFIVIDEWHRFCPKNPQLLAKAKVGPLGNHSYFVSATPLNPVMEQERQELNESPEDDNKTIKECRERALRMIAELAGMPIGESVLCLPFDRAIKQMRVNWICRRTGWKPPIIVQENIDSTLRNSELQYIGSIDSINNLDWKSKEAAWASGLIRTRYDRSANRFFLGSSRGRQLVFGHHYVRPHVVRTTKKRDAAQWLLQEHGRVPRLLDLLMKSEVIDRINGRRTIQYRLTGKKVLIFCIHQGVARGLQLALQAAIELRSNEDIFGIVLEEFTDKHQNDFMTTGKAPYILIATDRLSESVDLHGDCNLLIHYELPWSPLRLLQRVGRLTRMHTDKAFKDTEVYHVIIPGSVEEERVNRLIRRTELVHKEGAWPEELYGECAGNWRYIAKTLIGAGASMHLKEVLEGHDI